MIKSILVCTDGSEHGDAACEYAVTLAQQLKARLAALHVLDARLLEGPLMADISGWLGAEPFSAQLVHFRELLNQKGEAVVSAFRDLCQKRGCVAEARMKTGLPVRVILEEETRAELVVLGRQGEHAEWTGDLVGSTVERVVRHSIKPCLVTPVAFQPVKKIMAGYDGSGHASRALHEAIELAVALAVPLVILVVAEDGDEAQARERAEDAMKLARAHECVAAQLVVSGTPDELLRTKAHDLGCNLLVVGAYGHGRIREMILGSTTHQLIARCDLPVMLVR
jgi:nucleotide-binding universal stress UspA family protein